MVVILGQQYNIGEKSTVILYTYINRHAGTPEKQRKKSFVIRILAKDQPPPSNLVVYSTNAVQYRRNNDMIS